MSRDENGAINIGWNAILKLMDYIVTPPKETLSHTPKENPKGTPPKGGNDDDPGQGGGNNSQTNVVAPKSRPSRARGSSRGRGRGSRGSSSSRGRGSSSRVVGSRVVKDSDGGDGKSKENLHFRVVTSNIRESPLRVMLDSPK